PGSPAGEPGRPRLRSGARLQHPRAQRAVERGLERQLSRNPASRRSRRLAGPALGAGGVLCLESGRGILSERRMPASAQPPAASAPTLASRPLPERVRSLLGGILEYASDELERVLVSTLNEFEQQLFKYAEQARSNMVQTRWLEAQRLVKRTRPGLVPRFLILLEAELACVKDPPGQRTAVGGFRGGGELSLVENVELDEATVLTEIAGRAEVRNSLPLYLLGQRFGVLAGKPAFDAENLPIGPQALCRMIRQASECLELGSEHRLL